MTVVDGWKTAAARIGFRRRSTGQWISIRRGTSNCTTACRSTMPSAPRAATFVIERVGGARTPRGGLDDRGIEYYRFVQ